MIMKTKQAIRPIMAAAILASVTLTSSTFLTGCSAKGESLPAETETSTTVEASSEALTITTENSDGKTDQTVAESTKEESQTAQSEEESGQKDYFGSWTVETVLAYGQVGTYSSEEAEGLIGKQVNFSLQEATLINDQPLNSPVSFKNPNYKESVISSDEVTLNYGMPLEKLGLKEGPVTEVIVEGSNQDPGGCALLLQDSQTVILSAGGTFFKLVK